MIYPQGKLLVFSKAPEPGYVMTRLAGSLYDHGLDGANIAAKLHEFLLLERLNQATKDKIAPVELWCAPDKRHSFFSLCEKQYQVTLKDQPHGDLGERMAQAFEETLSTHAFAVLIGTDCPGMNARVIQQAFQCLRDEQGSVIVPAMDGGYVLIGISTPQPEIFTEMEWGTENVFKETCDRIKGRLQVFPHLWDIDHIEDLKKLIVEQKAYDISDNFRCYLEKINIQDTAYE